MSQISNYVYFYNNRPSSASTTSSASAPTPTIIKDPKLSRSSNLIGSPSSKTLPNINVTSSVEAAVVYEPNPIYINETDRITVNGETGIWSNKSEILNWKGSVNIQDYPICNDPLPITIKKKPQAPVLYKQFVQVRYLRPPTPKKPGDIIIIQERSKPTAPAPPIVLRQIPPRPKTPETIIIREAPPTPPVSLPSKLITIPGKLLPPPPRKLVIERLSQLPSKPQSVIIERWLPYKQQKRNVVFVKPSEPDPIVIKPRNVIVQWEPPNIKINKTFRDLGVIRANPADYVQQFGDSLFNSEELPDFVKAIRPPQGVRLAADFDKFNYYDELDGDIDALKRIDLDKEGLGNYKHLINPSYDVQGAINKIKDALPAAT